MREFLKLAILLCTMPSGQGLPDLPTFSSMLALAWRLAINTESHHLCTYRLSCTLSTPPLLT